MDKQTIAKKVADHVEKNRDSMVEFLRQVVAVPSIWGDVPQLAEPPSEKPPEWYEKLWDSTKVAGQEPVEPTAPPEDPDQPLQPESP